MAGDYKLEALLDLREQQKDQAESGYARELRELERGREFVAQKQAELEALEAQRLEERRKYDERVRCGRSTPGDAAILARYLRALGEDEAQLREALGRARAAVDDQTKRAEQARDALQQATRELEAAERHREAWEEEQRQRARRKRAEAMDDHAARRWMEEK